MKAPDVRLEKIHRQALQNPILRLATAFREGRRVPYWSDKAGRLAIVPKREFRSRLVPDCQIICGLNQTRHQVNQQVRAMAGYGRFLVHGGERLICLRNNTTWGLFNGQQVRVVDVHAEGKKRISLDIETDYGRVLTVDCLKEQFGRDLVSDFRSQDLLLFDYGYCVTAHKAQGSEWNSVVALEQIAKHWDPKRWRYTVATRAKERLTYFA
jgi:exodeoxyribonuclease-5